MQKILSVLLTMALLACSFALALEGNGYPAGEKDAAAKNSFVGTLDDTDIYLEFDDDVEYSNLLDGYIQACFFAFDEKEENYLEVYLFIPEDIAAGTTISDENAAGQNMDSAGIAAVEVHSDDSETEYVSCIYEGAVYPTGSSFSIDVATVEKTNYAIIMSGTIEATLLEMDGGSGDGFTLRGEFHFSLPNGAADPDAEESPIIILPDSPASDGGSVQI